MDKDKDFSYTNTFLKGIVKENPVFVMLLGCCPTLAVTTMAVNGLGMGLATTFVLLCSNIIISLLKKAIPAEVRLPCYIVIIAGFTTFVGLIMKAFFPALYSARGVFLSLITVNCIILARAEVFASKNGLRASVLDGLGCGIGFTMALILVGAIREIFGSGAIFGQELFGEAVPPMTVFILPAGGFFTLWILIAAVNYLQKKRNIKPKPGFSCNGCKLHCPGKENCTEVKA